MDLVNRLQARLDEEEFGIVDAPVAGGTPAKANEPVAAEESAPAEPVAETKPVVEEKPAETEPSTAVDPEAKEEIAPVAAAETAEVVKEGESAAKDEAAKVTADMSFKERMEQRAKRFGIEPKQQQKTPTKKSQGGGGGGSAKGKGGGNGQPWHLSVRVHAHTYSCRWELGSGKAGGREQWTGLHERARVVRGARARWLTVIQLK